MVRGRSIDKTIIPSRALTAQRDYRARKADRMKRLEEENAQLLCENTTLRQRLEQLEWQLHQRAGGLGRESMETVDLVKRDLQSALNRIGSLPSPGAGFPTPTDYRAYYHTPSAVSLPTPPTDPSSRSCGPSGCPPAGRSPPSTISVASLRRDSDSTAGRRSSHDAPDDKSGIIPHTPLIAHPIPGLAHPTLTPIATHATPIMPSSTPAMQTASLPPQPNAGVGYPTVAMNSLGVWNAQHPPPTHATHPGHYDPQVNGMEEECCFGLVICE